MGILEGISISVEASSCYQVCPFMDRIRNDSDFTGITSSVAELQLTWNLSPVRADDINAFIVHYPPCLSLCFEALYGQIGTYNSENHYFHRTFCVIFISERVASSHATMASTSIFSGISDTLTMSPTLIVSF